MRASIIVPARDEAPRLARALDALAGQRDLDGAPLDPTRLEILLLCNNCRDDTAHAARCWAKRHPRVALHLVEAQFAPENANVGHARRLLMDAACARLNRAASRQPRAICSTDADTRVAPTWVASIWAELSAGVEAVGGRVLVARDEDAPRRAYLLDTAYRLYAARLESYLDPQSADPWPRHFQFFGASLALTPRAYEAVGGLPALSCLEDVALERALRRHDIALRHSPHVRVTTSARSNGRVAVGLSTQLSEWQQLGPQRAWLVPSGEELRFKSAARRTLHGWHARAFCGDWHGAAPLGNDIEPLSRALRLNPRWLRARLERTPHFGALWDDIERALRANPSFRAQHPPVPIQTAIAQLRALLEGTAEK